MRFIWLQDRAAVLLFPVPDALDELLAADVVAADAFFAQAPLDHHLRGDAGVVGARQPERLIAAHAVPARGHIDLGVFEHVPDVERCRSRWAAG